MIIAIINFFVSISALAFTVEEILPDPAQEQRAQALFAEIRCLVCAGQSIADSDALLARDIRGLVRRRVRQGEADEAVIGYLASRYGEQILLRPPLKPGTFPLWFGPALVLVSGFAGIGYYARRNRRKAKA